MALVRAANIMAMVAIAIQTPVSAGPGGTSSTTGGGEATVVTAVRPRLA
jgi:hypothetical protein